MRPFLRLPALAIVAILALGVLPGTPSLAVAPAEAPQIVGPDGTTEPVNPILDWEPVAGASRYRVQVSTSATFGTLEWSGDVYATEATPTKDLPLGTIHWRVAATDGGSGVGPYSSASFTREWPASPILLAPADEAVIRYPALVSADPVARPDDVLPFRWEALPGAKQYRIEIDDAPDFLNATAVTTDGTSYSPIDLQTIGQSFYWRVQAISTNAALLSDWSETRSYRFAWDDVPPLLTPEDDETITRNLVLSWEPMAGATTYELQINPNGDWTNNQTLTATVKSARYSPITMLDNGSYYWRVRARDARSPANLGGWSEVRQFHVGYPDRVTLLEPADDDMAVETPTFRWTAIPRAAWYELQIGADPNFSPMTYDTCYTNHTTFTPYESWTPFTGSDGPSACNLQLAQGVVYHWRVRAVDAERGALSLWPEAGQDGTGYDKDWFRFVWHPLDVTRSSPEDGSTVSGAPPVLRWEAFQGAERYRVIVSKASGSQLIKVDTYATSYTPTVAMLAADGPFSWTVQTLDKDGVEGILTDAWTFSWTAPSAGPALTPLTPAFDPATPEVVPQDETAPSLSWTPVAGATEYAVWYARHGNVVFTPLTGGSAGSPAKIKLTAFTYTSTALASGIYDWYVTAYNASHLLIETSPTWSFGIRELALATYVGPPDCVSVADCAVLRDTPTLEWDAVPGAGLYLVTIASDPNFTTIAKTYRTANTSLTPRESLMDSQAGQAWYWFVRPCRSSIVCGPFNSGVFGNANAFRKKSLAITTLPVSDDGSVADAVVLDWEDYFDTTTPAAPQSAMQYRVDVSTVSDFTTIFDTRTVDQTTYTPFDKTYPDGPLYWRVAAVDGTDNLLTFGAGQPMTKRSGLDLCADPDACLPADAEELAGVPGFGWAPQPFTSQYELEVYKNGDVLWSPGNRVLLQKTKLVRWTPSATLAPGTYAWRVRRLDPDARAGVWTAGRTFTVLGDAPVLREPADGATAPAELVFRWDPPTVAAPQMMIETSTVAAFTSVIEKVTTVMTAWSPIKAYPKGTIHVRLSSINPRGVVLATSVVTSFQVGAAVSVTAKAPLADAPVDGAWTATFSAPVTGVSATSFTLRVAVGGMAVPATVTVVDSTHARLTPTAPLVTGQSYTATLGAAIKAGDGTALVPVSWTARTALVADDKGPSVTDTWDRDDSASASGGSVAASRTAGSSLLLPFTGTAVKLIATKGPTSGRAAVYLDGAKVATLDLYRATTAWKQTVWSRTGLSAGKHRVEVRVLGTHAAKAKDSWVLVDAFKVGTRTVEQTDPAVVATFARLTVSGATGGTVEVTELIPAGDTGTTPAWTFRFAGTGVAWYGIKGPSGGCASVLIDGTPAGTVDLYAATTSGVQRLFAKGGLAAGTHTLQVVTIGDKATASTGHKVWLDRLEVDDNLAGLSIATAEVPAEASPAASPEPSAEPDPSAVPEPAASAEPGSTPVPGPTATPTTDPTTEPGPTAEPEPTAAPAPEPTATPTPTATPEPPPDATAAPPDPKPERTREPVPDPTRAPAPDPTPEPPPDPRPEPPPADPVPSPAA